MKKPPANDDYKIFYVTINLTQQIYCIGYGFTKLYHKYIWAKDIDSAEKLASLWCTKQMMQLSSVIAIEAVSQDIKTYTFLEQVLNIPAEILQNEFQRREYPQDMRPVGQYITL